MKKNEGLKVFIDGFYGYKNLGDDYILYSLLNSISKTKCESTSYVLSADDKYDSLRESYSVKFYKRKRFPLSLFQKFRLITKSTHYLIGGGGLFPSDSFIKIAFYGLTVLFARILRKKCCMYGIDIAKCTKKSTKFLWKIILAKIDFMITRDFDTKDVLSFVNKKLQKKIIPSVDITFSLSDKVAEEEEHNKSIIWALAAPFSEEELTNPHFCERYEKLQMKVIDLIEKYKDFKHIFIPFYYENDTKLINDIVSHLSSNINYSIVKYSNFMGMRQLFKNNSLCVCMRFHSVIFSIFEMSNFIAISYAPKIERVLNRLGLEQYMVKYGVRTSDNYFCEKDLDENFETLFEFGLKSPNTSILQKQTPDLYRQAFDNENILLGWLE